MTVNDKTAISIRSIWSLTNNDNNELLYM